MTFSLPEKKTVPEHQADAYLSQYNPVSGQLYTVLDTTKNVRIIAANIKITWATTQPTPLELIITVDGQTLTFQVANPISIQAYYPIFDASVPPSSEILTTPNTISSNRAFLLEGRSVKVEARITWATTQPTPLVCRVKYAKY